VLKELSQPHLILARRSRVCRTSRILGFLPHGEEVGAVDSFTNAQ
jgi:hypothetical protein